MANEQQEREVLGKLEREGYVWIDHTNKPTEFVPSIEVSKQFPYAIVVDMNISLKLSNYFEHYEIVFDGRKESKMKISKEVYDALVEWRDTQSIYASSGRVDEFIDGIDLQYIPDIVNSWWVTPEEPVATNNRLIAIIRWVNGEDVFEIEKPKQWVVRSKEVNDDGDKHYWKLLNLRGVLEMTSTFELRLATKFDTKEEAESWANAHQEVVEVDK